jgi:CheY-like chemotaxis protein
MILDIEKPKILVVDDRRENLISMQRVLEDVDAEIYLAQSGQEGLMLLNNHQFALLAFFPKTVQIHPEALAIQHISCLV